MAQETLRWILSRRPTYRKLEREERKLESLRAHAALAGIREERAFRETEDPREQAMLRASMFGRGLGKSTIAEQEAGRLTGIQARRRAVLARQEEMALQGISILRKRRKAAKRQVYPQLGMAFLADVSSAAEQAAKAGAGGD